MCQCFDQQFWAICFYFKFYIKENFTSRIVNEFQSFHVKHYCFPIPEGFLCVQCLKIEKHSLRVCVFTISVI